VSRTTAKLWVGRAREFGIAQMPFPSRRPRSSPRETEAQIVAMVLAARALHPSWGARKLRLVLWPEGDAPVCERTMDRILARAGLVARAAPHSPAVGRFERESPNELWQIDFKGLGEPSPAYKILSVLDDRSRFLVSLSRIDAPRGDLVSKALWDVFGEYGMPLAILSDNENCFHCRYSKGPSYLEARLWRLGIKTPHGRAGHPQTQGKVERFHRTLQETLGKDLRNPERVESAMSAFRNEYNWTRPHEAIDMATPGSKYVSSLRKRPPELPPSVPPQGAQVRRVDASGKIRFRGETYRAGRGLVGELVAIVQDEERLCLRYAERNFARLEDIRV